jgi:hypothetical protein
MFTFTRISYSRTCLEASCVREYLSLYRTNLTTQVSTEQHNSTYQDHARTHLHEHFASDSAIIFSRFDLFMPPTSVLTER